VEFDFHIEVHPKIATQQKRRPQILLEEKSPAPEFELPTGWLAFSDSRLEGRIERSLEPTLKPFAA
jgi:hypothetical protein